MCVDMYMFRPGKKGEDFANSLVLDLGCLGIEKISDQR